MPEPSRFAFSRADFPEGFVFGTATSAYQIEGTQFGGAGPCHWDSFAATPGNVAGADDGARACEHYLRWEEDLDLVRDAGFDAYRFSISWARVLPEGAGAPNPEALDFYDRLVDGMLARGLQPWATLYHWELPSALADRGGWANRETAERFADYATLVAGRLGDRLHATATVNEPWCVAWLSHFLGAHAPGLRDIRAAARAMHHVLLAHGLGLAALRAAGLRELGAVLNFEFASPAGDSPADRAAARRQDALYNRWFVSGIASGAYPEDALEGLAPHMPAGWQGDMATISAPIDWLGVNYYTRRRVAADPGAPWPCLRDAEPTLPVTALGWEIYPEGLAHFLTWLHRIAARRVPLYVTENGMVDAEPLEDAARIAYVEAHLAAVRRAIAQGAPVRGYFLWSLLDNYEWAYGYNGRFGIVHVDFETMARTPKASWRSMRVAIGPAD